MNTREMPPVEDNKIVISPENQEQIVGEILPLVRDRNFDVDGKVYMFSNQPEDIIVSGLEDGQQRQVKFNLKSKNEGTGEWDKVGSKVVFYTKSDGSSFIGFNENYNGDKNINDLDFKLDFSKPLLEEVQTKVSEIFS